ncbi:hypothetical protein L1049_009296 [Liquidambar formosana]|uniref:Uncharacterized protein n=1 Tax=Liquidambar formosana TaxID=63359 RepID=A0AAP0SBZ9_LIQFO
METWIAAMEELVVAWVFLLMEQIWLWFASTANPHRFVDDDHAKRHRFGFTKAKMGEAVLGDSAELPTGIAPIHSLKDALLRPCMGCRHW